MRQFNKIKKKEKEFKLLTKELSNLYEAKRGLGVIKLDKPIRNGWVKHLALRDDISRRKDASVFQEIVNHCGVRIWGTDKRQADRAWNNYHSKKNETSFTGIRHLLGEKRKFISSMGRMWFNGFDWEWVPQSGYVKRYFCKVPRHFFVTKYSKSFITHKAIIDPVLESRIEKIEQRLISNEFFHFSSIERRKAISEFYHKKVSRRVHAALHSYDENVFDRNVYRDFNP